MATESTNETTTEKEVENAGNDSTQEIESLKLELQKSRDMLLRTAAEYDNFRKRSEREKDAIYSDASALAVASILPLADSLDLALKSAETQSAEYKKGIELLHSQMQSALKSLKVEPFGEVNDKFDPNLHNAISHKEDSKIESQNFISEVFQKGYKTDKKVIRHAMVEVTN